MDLDSNGSGEDLGGFERGQNTIRIYYAKAIYFQ